MPRINPRDVYPASNLPDESVQWGRRIQDDQVELKKGHQAQGQSISGLNRSVASLMSINVADVAANAIRTPGSPLNDAIHLELPLHVGPTEPTNPVQDTLWFNTTQGMLYWWSETLERDWVYDQYGYDEDGNWGVLVPGYYATTSGWSPSGEPEADPGSLRLGRPDSVGDSYEASYIAIGNGADIDPDYQTNAIAIGRDTFSSGYGVALGWEAESRRNGGVAIGYQARAIEDGGNSVAIGYQAQVTRNGSVALGYGAKVKNNNSLAIGYNAETTGATDEWGSSGYSMIALGPWAKAIGSQSVSMGISTESTGYTSVAVGFYSKARGDNSTAFGHNAEVVSGHNTGVAIGNYAKVNASAAGTSWYGSGIAIGNYAQSDDQGVAIGAGAQSSASYGVAIGTYGSSASAPYAIAVGNSTTASAENALAIGHNARATHVGSVAIGRSAATTKDNQAVLRAEELYVTPSTGGWNEEPKASTIVIHSPDGTPWRISVDDTGALTTTAVTETE